MNLSAVTHLIYDLDGVLLDTEPVYTQVTEEIVSEYGKTFDWSVKREMIGRPSRAAADHLVAALALPITAEQYLARRLDRLEELFTRTPAMAGAESFTRDMCARGFAQAVGTSSEDGLYRIKTAGHRDWFEVFDAVVVGDDPRIENGKPAPDIFLLAASDLGAAPERCLVVEDSPPGVEAACRAGMQVVALPDPAMDRRAYAGAGLVVDSFAELARAMSGLSR